MASLEKNSKGEWSVRYREGGRNRRKKIGPRKEDARAFAREVERSQAMGTLAHMDMGKDSLKEFVTDAYWPNHAAKKAQKTQTLYAYLLDKHIVPHLGSLPMAQITAGQTEAWLGTLEREGVGRVAQQKALTLLTGILNKAVKWGALASNGAALADRPKHRPRQVKPPTPEQVEAIRSQLEPGDATLVSVLAYAGLRPQEALALRWSDIGERTLTVGAEHKTGHRHVELLAPLAADLKEWKLLCGSRFEIVFPNTRGKPWSEAAWGNWRARVWHEVADFRPYDLRHAFASLLIYDGRNVVEIAQQLGHSPERTLNTYAHAFAELAGTGSAVEAIRRAREQLREATG